MKKNKNNILTEDEWQEKYQPLASFDLYKDARKYLEEKLNITKEPNLYIWTLKDSDDGESLFIASGSRAVNNIGFYICKNKLQLDEDGEIPYIEVHI